MSESFDRMEVSVVGVHVDLGQTHFGITVSAEPDVVNKIATSVVNGTLVVGPAGDTSFSTSVPIQVRLSASNLRAVVAKAGARVKLEGLNADSFEAEAESGAQVVARGRATTLRGVAKSGGIVDLSGVSAVNVSSQCQSGGMVRAG